MTNRKPSADIAVSVICSDELIAAEVRDSRPASITLFAELTSEQREELVHDAWTIGLRALGNAYAAAQEARLADVGGQLIADIDQQLQRHIQGQQQTMTSVMARFFDPTDGQVTQRLSAFVDDQGVLARLLDRFLSPQNSVLAEALARQVGESSPLFKKLSLTDSEGLVKVLEGQLRSVLHDGHAELVRALDPLAEDGAVGRLLRSLRNEIEAANDDRSRQLAAALAALDANDEHSLLSRLIRETSQARQELLNAVNPESPLSPMAILRNSMTALLKEQGALQLDAARQQRERQEQFEKEIREALARIETRRTQERKSTWGGLAFEDAVVHFLGDVTKGAPCIFELTGCSVGEVERCKKGDAVLRFTAESAFAGAAVVFEAKREHGYTVQKALDELDLARKNRTAVAGVFVLARSHAPDGFPSFSRHGSNVLVTWDDADPGTNAYLQAATLLGMGLVTRNRTIGDAGDITALRDVGSRIEAEVNRLEKMDRCNDAIRRNSEGIGEETRKARKALEILLRKTKETLQALNVELCDEEAERESPLVMAASSYGGAQDSSDEDKGRAA
jgi:hypothetical protein